MKKLDRIYNDIEYLNLVNDIIYDKNFLRIKKERHHGLSRLDHSLRVSYYSYLIAKKLGFKYKDAARGGLLHDYFLEEELSLRKRSFSMFFHPYYAYKNATNEFNLTEIEKDIIINHMFPTLPHKIPKYIESWLISIVDKFIATYEFYISYGQPFVYKYAHIYVIILLISKCL